MINCGKIVLTEDEDIFWEFNLNEEDGTQILPTSAKLYISKEFGRKDRIKSFDENNIVIDQNKITVSEANPEIPEGNYIIELEYILNGKKVKPTHIYMKVYKKI